MSEKHWNLKHGLDRKDAKADRAKHIAEKKKQMQKRNSQIVSLFDEISKSKKFKHNQEICEEVSRVFNSEVNEPGLRINKTLVDEVIKRTKI